MAALCNIDHYIINSMYFSNPLISNIFVLFKSSDHLKRFQIYSNSCHVNFSFTTETEQNSKISFLDINVICEQGKFLTSVSKTN